VTVEDVVQNLTDTGVYEDFTKWFDDFFGENGIVTKG